MKNKILFLILIGILFFSINLGSAALNVSLSDQGTGVKNISSGETLELANITIQVWDSVVAGNIIYNETFINGIINGSWNVMLGENSSNNLSLEYGEVYYKEYIINGEDVDFKDYNDSIVERKFFYSPLGDIGGEDLAGNININTTGNITADYFFGDGSGLPHETLFGLTGGTENEHYHLTENAAENTERGYISAGALDFDSSDWNDNGDGTIFIGNVTVLLYDNVYHEGIVEKFNITGGNFTLTDGTVSYIAADYNGGSPIIKLIAGEDVAEIDMSYCVPLLTISREGNRLFVLDWGNVGKGLSGKLFYRTMRVSPFVRQSGLMIVDEGEG
ncbi:unnamed protein product, partial [marine sediment metagenome]